MARKDKKPKNKKHRGNPTSTRFPAQTNLIDFLEEVGKPVKAGAILKGFGLKGERMRSLLVDRLYDMVRNGLILENRRREFCLTAKLDLITGTSAGTAMDSALSRETMVTPTTFFCQQEKCGHYLMATASRYGLRS